MSFLFDGTVVGGSDADDELIREREKIGKLDLERLMSRQRDLYDQIEALAQEIANIERQIGAWKSLLGMDSSQSRSDVATTNVSVGEMKNEVQAKSPRRQKLTDAVVELLQKSGHPLHYRRDIYPALALQGHDVRGEDPANSLLACFYDDPRLQRVGRGTYAAK